MAAGRWKVITTAMLLALALCACASGGDAPNASTEDEAPDFADEVRNLCAAAPEEEEALLEGSDLTENLKQVAEARAELIAALGELQVPPEREASFEAYLDELENYADAMARGTSEGDDRAAYQALVEGAESGVALSELADEADLPEECPPPAGTDVHNTLFVTKANLGCYEIGEDLLAAGPIEAPKSAKAISLVLELGKRVAAGIAREVREADAPGVDERIPVDELIDANKKRFMAVVGLGNTFGNADYDAYKQAAKRLKSVSREADRLALSVGLIQCAKVFNLLPF